ncbi:major facilitator superfamily domain-containing protein 6-like isoform X2 [Mytilus californianus]|uniref:major facilitator superfamily domain-containing protein 6-like isoform X1 n=1 Tax=Mytilus californianus TaxID=6549 RepID=UPI0022475B9B|nr:major facilitator superfamily domain-containing protein 6-like isoform X1 [Mytilus californianus]XP_052076347.1 major facilitator superfamily domain-containing protein 6-like isoform X2 [Mytilus californianus]
MTDSQTAKWYKIDLGLLRVKGFYFFNLAAIGGLLPFMALYMKQIGMTKSQTGIIYGLMPFVGFLVRPLFGALADKLQKHKLILFLCCLLTGLSFILMILVPSKHTEHTKVTTEIMCSQGDSFIRDCYHVNQSINMLECPMSFHNYITKAKEIASEESFVTKVVNSSSSNNVPYIISTMPNEQNDATKSKLSCSLKCTYKVTPELPQKVCFTNATGTYNIADCYNVNSNVGKWESHVSFQIPDLGYLLSKEVISNKIKTDDQICRIFDLKDIVFKGQEYWQMLCSDDAFLVCDLQCSHVDTCTRIVAENLSQTSFWFFFILFLLGNIFFAPIMSLGDAILYDILGEENRHKWGKQRLWGTVGFAVFAIVSALSMDILSSKTNMNNFGIAFCLFFALNLATAIVSCIMRISDTLMCGQMLKGTITLLREPKTLVFLLVVFYFGSLTGAIEAFLYWFLEDELENKLKIIPGLCLLFACIAETPILYFAGSIIKKFGHVTCLYAAFLAYALRFTMYSILENAWWVLPIELLHGITFGIMWAAATSYGSIITPVGMSGTIQGLLSGVHFGFGKGVGSLVTGQLYSQIGIRWTFGLYAILSFALFILYLLLNKLVFTDDDLGKAVEETELKIGGKGTEGTEDRLLAIKPSENDLLDNHDNKPAEQYAKIT